MEPSSSEADDGLTPAERADLDLDGRVPPGIEDFAGSDLLDDGHWCLLALGDVTG